MMLTKRRRMKMTTRKMMALMVLMVEEVLPHRTLRHLSQFC